MSFAKFIRSCHSCGCKVAILKCRREMCFFLRICQEIEDRELLLAIAEAVKWQPHSAEQYSLNGSCSRL